MIVSTIKKTARRVIEAAAPAMLVERHHKKFRDDEIEVAILDLIVPPNTHAIDVGANWGVYAKTLSGLCRAVHCLEPNPFLARMIARTLPANCHVQQAAASHSAGFATLHIPVTDGRMVDGLASLNTFDDRPVETVHVPTIRLDDITAEKVGFVKIDVEGAEAMVLEGATHLITFVRPLFLIEIEERHRAGAIAQARALFEREGYEGYFIDEDRMKSIAEFDADTMQDSGHFDQQKHRRSQRYVNNFLFAPAGMMTDAKRQAIDARLASLPRFAPDGSQIRRAKLQG